MCGKKALLTLAVISALGILGAATASGNMDGGDHGGGGGGGVTPCSLAGVNPAHHPEIFGNPAVAAREYGFIKSRDGTWHVEPNCHR
jgi:hypothetical protein